MEITFLLGHCQALGDPHLLHDSVCGIGGWACIGRCAPHGAGGVWRCILDRRGVYCIWCAHFHGGGNRLLSIRGRCLFFYYWCYCSCLFFLLKLFKLLVVVISLIKRCICVHVPSA